MRLSKLKTKILLTVSLALVASMIISGLISNRLHRSQLIRHHVGYQQSLLRIVKNGIVVSMRDKGPEELQSILDGIRANTNIVCLKILSLEGEVKFSTQVFDTCSVPLSEISFDSLPNIGFGYYEEKQQTGSHLMTAITSVENVPECHQCHNPAQAVIGYLVVQSDISGIDQNLKASQFASTLASLGVLVLFSTIIYLVHLRSVQRSMRKILKAVTDVEQGNFMTYIHVPAGDEMGRLAVSFNRMIDRLNLARTELTQLHQEQLERAGKLAHVGELAAGMAHEIRNPVAGISSAMKVMMEDMDLNHSNRPIFEEILRQLERVNRAVNDLLSYARPQTPSFTETDVSNVIDDALKLASQQAEIAKIEIVSNGSNNLPLIFADPIQLEQVLVNLFMNGVQSMQGGGKLTVEKRYDSVHNNVEISIEDSGHGIKSEHLDKIFKPFFTTKHKGTGLGLAICQGIIQRHGGEIHVTSEPERGSTFLVVLPAEGPDGP